MNDAVIDGLSITVSQIPHIWEQRENGKAYKLVGIDISSFYEDG